MTELGKTNHLKVVKKVDFGLYLDGDNLGEILLPKRYTNAEMNVGDVVKVFIYLDGEERYTATTDTPKAEVDQIAYLKVKSIEKIGAFLDWGIMKDILVPFSEQKISMELNKYYPVFIYIDKITERITGTMKLEKFIHKTPPLYQNGEEVSGMIISSTDLAYKAVIQNLHFGLLYKNEVFKPLMPGQKLILYVKKVRDDGKIDLTLEAPGYQKIDSIGQNILDRLKKEGGFLAIHDKTDAEVIYRTFGISKKVFKTTIGNLYKNRKIQILPNGIQLV
ncbi:MAG: GntR family transcriptional regulator [Saprospiraceae bacterium]|nr:GntR family transcriptional regulator [Saprospiraceae bacterium]MBK6564529.1 GntR family transcriptional regulator [Saprospiraceae bacterium]MBK6782715.1 GntR family transcriptional regulator [Saprospiraceae bacterium]MBK7523166.1 GntR family transcriptional regulator [Saprospiraceae bacterium]MBK8371840.1 GntR family transcriptional regulator [Saprospiraceae bacterium]